MAGCSRETASTKAPARCCADGELQVPGGDVLDLGCGYGPIALTLARRNPAATVWALDVNERARALCAENAATAGLDNVRVVAPDEVPDGMGFAALWSNPPIRIGKVALHDLLLRWLGRLDATGAAHLVVHKNLGSDSLARWMNEQGWATVRRSSHDGYRLLDVTRSPTSDGDQASRSWRSRSRILVRDARENRVGRALACGGALWAVGALDARRVDLDPDPGRAGHRGQGLGQRVGIRGPDQVAAVGRAGHTDPRVRPQRGRQLLRS